MHGMCETELFKMPVGRIVVLSCLFVNLCTALSFTMNREESNDLTFVVNRLRLKAGAQNVTEEPNLVQLAQQLNLTMFVSALTTTRLNRVLNHEGPFTVFAPTNEAFIKAPSYCNNVPLEDRMRYHVTRGIHYAKSLANDQELWTLLSHHYVRVNIYKKTKAVTASGRQVVLPDQNARNGIIHVIKDEICSIYKGGAMFEISRCPPLRIFAKAVNMSGLFSTLDSEDPVTIFAPTNDAIRALPVVIKNKLMRNATFMKMVIRNHVVPQTVYRAGMYDKQILKTAAGFKLMISVANNVVKINGKAKITLADATVQNGVVHSVDNVLIPKSLLLHL